MNEFKKQLAAFMSLYDLGEIDQVWRDRSQWKGLPEWVDAVLYVEESRLGVVLNGCANDWQERQIQFEALMQKCDVWWEMENCCVVWIYEPTKLDAVCAAQEE